MGNNLSLEDQRKLQKKLKVEINNKISSEQMKIDESISGYINGEIKDDLFDSILKSKQRILDYQDYLVTLDIASKQTLKKLMQSYVVSFTDRVKTVSKSALSGIKRELKYLSDNKHQNGSLIINVSQDRVLTTPIYKKKKFRIKSYADNLLKLDMVARKTMNALDNFFTPFKNILSIKEVDIENLEKQKINMSDSKAGTYNKQAIDNFKYLLEEKRKRELANKVINEGVDEKQMSEEEKIAKIRKRNLGYVNFYLILIATIFLSLLSILLGFQILGY